MIGLIDGISAYTNLSSPLGSSGNEIGWMNVFDMAIWQPNEQWTSKMYQENVSRTDVQTALSMIAFPEKEKKEYAAAATVLLSR